MCASAALAESTDWIQDRAALLFLRIHAKPTAECPPEIERVGDARAAYCASYHEDVKTFKKSLKRFDDKPNRAVTQKSGDDEMPWFHTASIVTFHRTWYRYGSLHYRDWLEDGQLLRIAYDEDLNTLAVLPKDSCFGPDVRARDELYFEGEPGLLAAEAVNIVLPPKPADTPSGIAKGGDAVVQFVVDREGAVTDTCVMHSRPSGFGKRAAKTVREWVFLPAMMDEATVDSVVSYAFTWRQGDYDYERTTRPALD